MAYAQVRQSEEPASRDEEEAFHAAKETASDISDGAAWDAAISDSRPARSRSRFDSILSLFLVFALVITTLCLTGLTLGEFSSFATDANNSVPAPPSSSSSDEDEQLVASNYYQHQDEIPSSPRWRKADEYVLSSAWDYNAPPTTREYNWTITDAVFNPDGVFRPMILINNQFPGPLVEANDGDTLVVHVVNRGVNATSMHFHGMFQNGTNAMDGTVGVTQCPIAPGSDYTYRFQVKGQSGTYWYHAHHSAQASDGLVGPFVVHAPNERTELQELSYDTDRVFMVQDHYYNVTSELLMDYLQPRKENEEPVPDSALINGRGNRKCADLPGWQCDDSALQMPELRLAKGQRHRLRVINVGAFAEFQIQVDEHPFYVTEVDGTDVHPEPFHRLNIMPAQRYSIILETNATGTSSAPRDNEEEKNDAIFWLRARMTTHCFTEYNPYMEPETRAIIRYIDPEHSDPLSNDYPPSANIAEPTSANWDEAIDVFCKDLNTTLLHPVIAQEPPEPDAYASLRASFRIGAWRLSRGFFNSSTWHPNITSPSLHRFLDAPSELTTPSPLSSRDEGEGEPGFFGQAQVELFNPDNEYVLQSEGIQTVDIAINNFDDGAHPFHLHGHKFWVLTPSMRGYPPATLAELRDYYRQLDAGELKEDESGGKADGHDVTQLLLDAAVMRKNPLRRDTVTVGGYQWVIIRVVLDNPGLWALHCHNAWHAEAGMAMQFLVRGDELRKQNLVGDEERGLCTRPGVRSGVRPDDSIWFGTFD